MDDVIAQVLEESTTWAEAREALCQHLAADGLDADDALLNRMLVACCGGDVVEIDALGQPVNPRARKFFQQEEQR